MHTFLRPSPSHSQTWVWEWDFWCMWVWVISRLSTEQCGKAWPQTQLVWVASSTTCVWYGSNPRLGWLGLGPGLKPSGKNSKMSSPFTQSVSPVPTSLKWYSTTIVFYWSVQRMAAIGGGRARMGVGCSHSILCVLYSSALFV